MSLPPHTPLIPHPQIESYLEAAGAIVYPLYAKCVGGKLKCHLSRWFTMTAGGGESTAEDGAEAAKALDQPYLPMAIIRWSY